MRRVKVLLTQNGSFHFDDVDEELLAILKKRSVPIIDTPQPRIMPLEKTWLTRRLATPSNRLKHLKDTILWAEEAYTSCRLCHLRCGGNRYKEDVPCNVSVAGNFFDLFVHPSMEGSLERVLHVMARGCSLNCFFCSKDQERSGLLNGFGQVARGDVISVLRNGDFQWVAFSGGNPDENVLAILRLLAEIKELTRPIAWETHGCVNPDLLSRLSSIVDLFILSLKFGNDACAAKYCGVKDYIGWMENTIAVLKNSGASLLLRLSIIPGHESCCHDAIRNLAIHNCDQWSEITIFPAFNCETAPFVVESL